MGHFDAPLINAITNLHLSIECSVGISSRVCFSAHTSLGPAPLPSPCSPHTVTQISPWFATSVPGCRGQPNSYAPKVKDSEEVAASPCSHSSPKTRGIRVLKNGWNPAP